MPSFPTAGPDWRTRDLRQSDREAVLDLWERSFGEREERATEWLALVEADAPATGWVGVDDAGTVVGFLVAAVGDRAFARDYLDGHPVAGALPDRFAFIHMLGVDPGWRSTGIATALVQRSFDWGADRVPLMLVVLWRREEAVDSGALARKFEFTHVCTLENYYVDRGACPDCDGECTCTATVAVRSFAGEEHVGRVLAAAGE